MTFVTLYAETSGVSDYGWIPSSSAALIRNIPGWRANWLSEARSAILEMLDLKPGWDTYGGAPIDPRTAEKVFGVLRRMSDLGLPKPFISPTSKGGITTEWNRGLDGIEMSFDRDGVEVLIDRAGEMTEARRPWHAPFDAVFDTAIAQLCSW